ncbi:MAG: N-formylglutamate amidohydrolase [Endozoicomonas sp.]
MQGLEQSSAEWVNPQGQSDVLLVCEHASQYIPEIFDNLGLSETERLSHIAWDIGAAGVARELSAELDASLVLQRYSRLLYDCNRPPGEVSAVPLVSEKTTITGNQGLTEEQRNHRVKQIYEPFHAGIADHIRLRKAAGRRTILVTIHSFTPVFLGQVRKVQLGVISQEGNAFARSFHAMVQQLSDFDIRMNEPYGPSDPVLHLITRHGEEQQLPCVMLELRNDLVEHVAGQKNWARLIAEVLNRLTNPDIS